jgi:eukaryotic-like serine/threonine-protein kinase
MLKAGDTVDRYTIEACIGEGGMGAVYRARDTRLGRLVALKLIADSAAGAEANARLLREARAAAALDHPNAVAVFDVGEHEGVPFIVMELVSGNTLRSRIGEPASLAERVGRLTAVGRALAAAHRVGVVHRDIKPENVMIRDDGVVKVLDFGIARRATGEGVDPTGPTHSPALGTLTIDGAKLGTPVYMAPEQIRGDTLDCRADQFSWGVMAYELLAGRLPWRGNDALAAMASALTDRAPREPLAEAGAPRPVQDVLLRALAKDPAERFAGMDDVVRALEAAAAGEELPERLPPAKEVGATAAQRFTTGEVREVLAKAIEREAAEQGSTKLRFEDLLAVGAEVGIDAESLRDASRALRAAAPQTAATGSAIAERDAWIRRRRRNFVRHAGIYAIVNGAMFVLGLILLAWVPFWVWLLPALAWGIALAIHGLVALTSNEDDWDEERRDTEQWLENRRRRHEEKMVRRGGKKPRVEEEPAKRVRLATDTHDAREAEAEEVAASEEAAQRRRR